MPDLPLTPQQLQWRCRRGVRELDVLFTRFLEVQYPSLDNQQQYAFQQLLEVQDPTIMDWLFEREPVSEVALEPIIKQLQEVSGIK